jgi:hypothetical protein
MTNPDKPSDTSQQWQQFERHDRGFAISYPTSWEIVYPGNAFVLIPNPATFVFDQTLGRNVASPAVNIVLSSSKKNSTNMVTAFSERRSAGYEGYSVIKTLSHTVAGARYVMAYEFQFGLPNARSIALSVLVQRKIEMFNVTAEARIDDFERERDTLQHIVFSFHLTPGYAELPYWSETAGNANR